jgi:hypothetical protein
MDLENRLKLSGKPGKVMEFELFKGVATLCTGLWMDWRPIFRNIVYGWKVCDEYQFKYSTKTGPSFSK